MRGKLLHDVALRHDADDAAVGAGDNQRADLAFGQKLGRGGKIGRGLDGETSLPLTDRMALTVIGSLPDSPVLLPLSRLGGRSGHFHASG